MNFGCWPVYPPYWVRPVSGASWPHGRIGRKLQNFSASPRVRGLVRGPGPGAQGPKQPASRRRQGSSNSALRGHLAHPRAGPNCAAANGRTEPAGAPCSVTPGAREKHKTPYGVARRDLAARLFAPAVPCRTDVHQVLDSVPAFAGVASLGPGPGPRNAPDGPGPGPRARKTHRGYGRDRT